MTPRPARRTPLAVLAAVALGTAACASSTVSGQGALGGGAPTGATSSADFPSSGPSTGSTGATAAPTDSGSSAVASTSVPASPTATSGGSGVLVTDTAGHFQVRMPAEPARTSQPGSFGGYTFNVHVDSVHSPYLAIVEGEDITPALPQNQSDVVLRSAVTGFETSSGMTKESEAAITFEGHTARGAIFSRSGERYQFLVVAYSGSQVYMMFAPRGDRFDALAASFHATV